VDLLVAQVGNAPVGARQLQPRTSARAAGRVQSPYVALATVIVLRLGKPVTAKIFGHDDHREGVSNG
jgi:hypothetical protein